MLSAQQILVASLDYRRLLARTGMTLSMQTRRVLNGQTEFLCARAEVEDCPTDGAAEWLEAARHAHGETTHTRPTSLRDARRGRTEAEDASAVR